MVTVTEWYSYKSVTVTFRRKYLYIKRGKVSVYVCNAGRGQLSSECRHNENDVIMRTGAASAVGSRRAYDVIMRITS